MSATAALAGRVRLALPLVGLAVVTVVVGLTGSQGAEAASPPSTTALTSPYARGDLPNCQAQAVTNRGATRS